MHYMNDTKVDGISLVFWIAVCLRFYGQACRYF